MPGIRRQRDRLSREESEDSSGVVDAPAARDSARESQGTDALDDVLDDIASTLESNAEEYVNGFVQQGGE
ncbi:ubiquitin-like protein Pup [uncultured Bifidobacterium sp.]|uniref:ubiquitin-like protein Pup n=1 Tax=uncultured Bifidobacterium sp. TaxID=165187 RepID=UPI0028DD3316|nr:ubiquitin-like protein Pup [uncultured Bifidobacterium sp.]